MFVFDKVLQYRCV